MIDTLLNIIAPHVCVVCGAEGDLLCIYCGNKCISSDSKCFFCETPTKDVEICKDCSHTYHLHNLTSVGWYVDELKQVVYNYKFGAKRGGAKCLAELMARVKQPVPGAVVTYIPTTAIHIRERGFDHAKLLAQYYAAGQSLPCVATLARTNNHRQLGISKSLRQATIVGTFKAIHKPSFVGKDIVLLDDVITTGSTMQEAAKVLLRAGARSVSALVVAKTPPKTRPNR